MLCVVVVVEREKQLPHRSLAVALGDIEAVVGGDEVRQVHRYDRWGREERRRRRHIITKRGGAGDVCDEQPIQERRACGRGF